MDRAQHIPNEALRRADVPPRGAEWSTIVRFAQTFNGYEQMGDRAQCADLANHPEKCISLSDFRACLFFEYRRHNHFGRPPDPKKMEDIYEVLDRIREFAKTD